MAIDSTTFPQDILFFIKNDLLGNITDPLSTGRQANSAFVMTSYPQRPVQYPIITIKLMNQKAERAGMQTTAMDVIINLEIRIWGRNQKEKDTLANNIYKRLRDIQFTSGGSALNNLHDFQLLSAVEIDEAGDNMPKSRVLQVQYSFFNI